MNRNSTNSAPRAAPKQPPSSYYRQRLAYSIGSNSSRAPPQSARTAIPNDTNTNKRPLENSYQPQPKRASGPSNTLAPKGTRSFPQNSNKRIDSFYKQATPSNKPPTNPAPNKPNTRYALHFVLSDHIWPFPGRTRTVQALRNKLSRSSITILHMSTI